jgi:hypothetical protein
MIEPTAVLERLDDVDTSMVDYAKGYADRLARRDPQFPFDHLEHFDGRPLAQARLLQVVADLPAAWAKAKELGTEVDQAYWSDFSVYGRGEFALVDETSRQLLDHGRVGTALFLMQIYVRGERTRPSPELVAEGLKKLGPEDGDLGRLSSYGIGTLIEYLRQSDIDEDEVATLEWKLLPTFRFEPKGLLLGRKLARDPAFFVEVLSLCFRARNAEKSTEVPPHVATNAFRLLRSWETIPGTEVDVVNIDALKEWYLTTEQLLVEADRLDIGQQTIGQVLAHAPADEDGLWPCVPVRSFIEHVANKHVESGFRTGCFNKRGVTTRSLAEGGKQEYDLAEQYAGWARRMSATAPRTAAVLRSLADGYVVDGRREDNEARRRLEGFND